MEIRKRFSPSIKGKKNGRSKTNHGNGSDKIEEKTEEKEIVVSLKKLKTKIKGDNGINGKEVEIEGEKYTLLKIIEKLKNDREKAKKILINWINKFYNDIIENDNNKLALIYCLETFAFRKDFRNEVKVKFGNAGIQLQQKVIQFGNKKEIKCENMEELHKKIKSTEKISDEITKLEAGKSAKARRASRKLLKKAILETNTIKHKLIQKLKPPTEERTTTRIISTGGNNGGSGKVNLVLTQLSPKAQKEFDRLRTKVYGHGFIGDRIGSESLFVLELKKLKHRDFGNLTAAIGGSKSLSDIIKYLKNNKSTDNLPYTTTFLDDLIETCEELEKQLESSQTPEKQPLSDADKSSDNSQIGREENVVDGTPSLQSVEAIKTEKDTTPQNQTSASTAATPNGQQESSDADKSPGNSQIGQNTSRVSKNARKNPAFEEIKKIYDEITAIDIKELTLEKIKEKLNILAGEPNYLSQFIEKIINDLGKQIELNVKYSWYFMDEGIKSMIGEICDKAQKIAKIDTLMESVKTDLSSIKGEACLDFGTLKIYLSRVEKKLSESSIKDLPNTGKKLILTDLQTYLKAVIKELDVSKPLNADLPKVASYESISENGDQEIITILKELWKKAYNVSKVIDEDSEILKKCYEDKNNIKGIIDALDSKLSNSQREGLNITKYWLGEIQDSVNTKNRTKLNHLLTNCIPNIGIINKNTILELQEKLESLQEIKSILSDQQQEPSGEGENSGNPKPEEAILLDGSNNYIIKRAKEVLTDKKITFENAKRFLDDIKTNEAIDLTMRTVLAKIPEPIKGNTFPENLELLSVNADVYQYLKELWLKAQELAPNESVTGTTPTPQILKPNFPISEAVPQATAVEGTQGAEPQQQFAEVGHFNTPEMQRVEKIKQVQSLEPNEAIFVDGPIAGEDLHVGQHLQPQFAEEGHFKIPEMQRVEKIKQVQSLEPNKAIFVDEPIAGSNPQGAKPQQHGEGDSSLKEAPSQNNGEGNSSPNGQ